MRRSFSSEAAVPGRWQQQLEAHEEAYSSGPHVISQLGTLATGGRPSSLHAVAATGQLLDSSQLSGISEGFVWDACKLEEASAHSPRPPTVEKHSPPSRRPTVERLRAFGNSSTMAAINELQHHSHFEEPLIDPRLLLQSVQPVPTQAPPTGLSGTPLADVNSDPFNRSQSSPLNTMQLSSRPAVSGSLRLLPSKAQLPARTRQPPRSGWSLTAFEFHARANKARVAADVSPVKVDKPLVAWGGELSFPGSPLSGQLLDQVGTPSASPARNLSRGWDVRGDDAQDARLELGGGLGGRRMLHRGTSHSQRSAVDRPEPLMLLAAALQPPKSTALTRLSRYHRHPASTTALPSVSSAIRRNHPDSESGISADLARCSDGFPRRQRGPLSPTLASRTQVHPVTSIDTEASADSSPSRPKLPLVACASYTGEASPSAVSEPFEVAAAPDPRPPLVSTKSKAGLLQLTTDVIKVVRSLF